MLGRTRFGFAALCCGLITACNSDSNDILAKLKENRSKWENKNIGTYQLSYRKSCFCLDEAVQTRKVFVEDDEVVSQVIADTNEALRTSDFEVFTINELFALIALEESTVESIEVEYDEEFGYPTVIRIDGNKQIADDEYSLYITEFDPITEPVSCTTDVTYGLSLSIIDIGDATPIACDVTVTAIDHEQNVDYSETAINDGTACSDDTAIAMLAERAGFYKLTIEKTGYQTLTIEDVGIGRGICHVYPYELTVELTQE